MRRHPILLVFVLVVVLVAGVPAAASATPDLDVATLDARIDKAQARVDRWYARIEGWYRRIDRAVQRVERFERAAAGASVGSPVVRRTMPRRQQPGFLLVEATRELRATLKDPWARHVQAELDTWTAYLAEMVHARERALHPSPDDGGGGARGPRGSAGGGGRPSPAGPLTYERWAGEFLRRLGAPRCGENLLIVVTWETAESTSAAFNPLATTRDMPGATDMNTVGVKHFVSLDQGLDASRDTLLLGAESYGYGAIVDSLRGCRAATVTARAINASAWCRGCVGGAYITGLLPIVRASYPEHAARLVSTSA
jgi:hypothetical protein